jgi:hypothetical protein
MATTGKAVEHLVTAHRKSGGQSLKMNAYFIVQLVNWLAPQNQYHRS